MTFYDEQKESGKQSMTILQLDCYQSIASSLHMQQEMYLQQDLFKQGRQHYVEPLLVSANLTLWLKPCFLLT